MNSRPWNSRPDGPNEGQKFADDLAQKMGASQLSNRFSVRLAHSTVGIAEAQLKAGLIRGVPNGRT